MYYVVCALAQVIIVVEGRSYRKEIKSDEL